VGFDPSSAFLWDSSRQKHNENGRGRDLFVKRVLEIKIKNPLFFRG
jgi:hypothetical protein